MNYAEQLDRFYQDLREPDSNRYPLALAASWFDEAEREVNKVSRQVFATEEKNSVANQREYAYPSDILDYTIDVVYYSTGDSTERKELKFITIDKLNSKDRLWRTRTGTPTYWYHDKHKGVWGLYRYETSVASGTNCIEIHYRSKHTKMATLYTTGTIAVTNANTAVTGSGTVWVGNVVASDKIAVGALLSRSTAFPTAWSTVSINPTGNTAIVLSVAYPGATASGQSYIATSPSSITNDTLNMCSVRYAMGLAKQKDKEYGVAGEYMRDAIARAKAEVNRLNADRSDDEPAVPEMAWPYPGESFAKDDYQR